MIEIKEKYADLHALGDITLAKRAEMLAEHRKEMVKAISHWQENLDHFDLKIEHYEKEISQQENR